MEITAFEKRLDETTAIERTRNLSTKEYVYTWLADRLGWELDDQEFDVMIVYYPDYIAYTTATIRQTLRGNKTLKFLAAVDAVTGRAGEVDVELPTQRTIDADQELVIPPQIDAEEAESTWREWLFKYVGRYHRATEMPEYSLDELELVYTPYWVIDYGSMEESLAVSDLTGRTARIEEIEVLEEFYTRHM
ncbi:hypothetical protein D8Y22_14495 [Salinadaptatus halalkaliphilus]|uniref:Uncharacterized protein n=1 Tax=Salinadaptatus halalkaliphilus TaxID=2419781 RepID=A0A4S3TNK1_9EURY|nr:hypothetical protein [Salinadaptatus halalkaliphilus]THE64118.1 hypothetical protein D8Y22_14495 [Salinadaptatus halalkaliphilus]